MLHPRWRPNITRPPRCLGSSNLIFSISTARPYSVDSLSTLSAFFRLKAMTSHAVLFLGSSQQRTDKSPVSLFDGIVDK